MVIRKAVIPAAGLGTRFLPATKAMPKEMLPVVDKPAIQYVVEEAVTAGLDDVLIILGRNKDAITNHFDRMTELEHTLAEKNDFDKLRLVEESTHVADVHYVRQGDPKGLGHAVLRAKQHVGDEAFAVLLGDELIEEQEPILPLMIEQHARTGASVVALMEVDPGHINLYGSAAFEPTEVNGVVRITGLIEKPSAEEAPSNFAVVGRYILSPSVFDVIERTQPGKGGEIQLTDALQTLATDPAEGVYGVVLRGRRHDTGNKVEYIKTVVEFALNRDDLAPELKPWLKELAAKL